MILNIKELAQRMFGKSEQPGWQPTRKQQQAAKTLYTTPEWPTYIELLDFLCKLYAEQLLSRNLVSEDVHYLRGYISGIRRAGTLIDEIIHQENQSGADDARERAERRAAERAKLALYGTNWYTPTK